VLGIVAWAAVFVAALALAVPIDDAGLLLVWAL
jgi:hypothetical protein